MTSGRRLTQAEHRRERALLYTSIADVSIVAVIAVVALSSGSLTMGAELVRTFLMVGLEVFSCIAIWRIHRGRFADFEFGHGKIEQLANLRIAVGFPVGDGLILTGSIEALTGDPQVLSPLGLAMVASVAAVNTGENFLAWAAMRRAAKVEASTILISQMRARWVKLVSSVVVQLALTIAALTYEPPGRALAGRSGRHLRRRPHDPDRCRHAAPRLAGPSGQGIGRWRSCEPFRHAMTATQPFTACGRGGPAGICSLRSTWAIPRI